MLTNDAQKPNTVRHTEYKLLELATHVTLLFTEKAILSFSSTALD